MQPIIRAELHGPCRIPLFKISKIPRFMIILPIYKAEIPPKKIKMIDKMVFGLASSKFSLPYYPPTTLLKILK